MDVHEHERDFESWASVRNFLRLVGNFPDGRKSPEILQVFPTMLDLICWRNVGKLPRNREDLEETVNVIHAKNPENARNFRVCSPRHRLALLRRNSGRS